MTLSEFLIHISDQALSNSKYYLQPGHNGPYNDSETLVRNYGHWLITFSKCFKLTGNKIYLNKITELAEYLISKKSRPFGFSFNHRLKEGKDKCNGLIGQAWTFESLICASSVIADKKYSEIAEDVFFQHNFNNEFGLWNILETDGTILSIDNTFNHQLWFAACASLLNTPRQETIRNRIYLFLDFLLENISVLDNGLIYHPIERPLNHNGLVHSIKSKLKKVTNTSIRFYWNKEKKSNHYNKEYNDKMLIKSVGYHQFNMYAFALLKESIPDHPFWKSPEFNKSVNFLLSDEYKNEVSENKYGFPYNPPGFEIPYALKVFADISSDELIKISSLWVNEQFKRCYNTETKMMDKNTEDPLTHTARIYELSRLPISILKKIELNVEFVGDFS